jgi:cellulose synthase/poly-beta-1,6-N-acetylglucosamine synthase-like glycosyltransferase
LLQTPEQRAQIFTGFLLCVWLALCSAVFFNSPLSKWRHDQLAGNLIIVVILVFVSVFAIQSVHCAFICLACTLPRRRDTPGATSMSPAPFEPPVAILYTFADDFDPIAAASCLYQDYQAAHVFLLDDSTDERVRAEVEKFIGTKADPNKFTLVRRDVLTGFKAGNLNHALREQAREFPLFAVIDADCVLPSSFIRSLVTPFSTQADLAFAQARCECRETISIESVFAHEMQPAVNIFWSYYEAYRCRFGFVGFMGHGALVSRKAWNSIGGFPEVLSEDLAFSIETALRGFTGTFTTALSCSEAVPESFLSFRRRQLRYCTGAAEILVRYWRDLAGRSTLYWWERVDIVLGALSNIVPALVVPYLLILSWLVLTATVSTHGFQNIFATLLRSGVPLRGQQPLARTILGLSGIFLIVPGLTAYVAARVSNADVSSTLAQSLRGRRRRVRYVFWATVVHLAIMPDCALSIIRFLARRKPPQFGVTGSRRNQEAGPGIGSVGSWVLIAIGAATVNLYLIAIGVARIIARSPLMTRNTRAAAAVRSIPALIVIVVIFCLFVLALAPEYWPLH